MFSSIFSLANIIPIIAQCVFTMSAPGLIYDALTGIPYGIIYFLSFVLIVLNAYHSPETDCTFDDKVDNLNSDQEKLFLCGWPGSGRFHDGMCSTFALYTGLIGRQEHLNALVLANKSK